MANTQIYLRPPYSGPLDFVLKKESTGQEVPATFQLKEGTGLLTISSEDTGQFRLHVSNVSGEVIYRVHIGETVNSGGVKYYTDAHKVIKTTSQRGVLNFTTSFQKNPENSDHEPDPEVPAEPENPEPEIPIEPENPVTPEEEVFSVNPLAEAQGRRVTSLDIIGGKIYSGFGDWNLNGDTVGVVSHDLASGEAFVEYSPVDSEALERYVEGPDGSIYAPHIDGNGNYWAGCGYATNESGEWEDIILPGQAIHVFDICFTDEGMWACGSAIPEDQDGGTSALWFKPYGGEWRNPPYKGNEDHGGKGSYSRFYYLATDGHSVRVQDRGLPAPGLEVTANSVKELPRISSSLKHVFVNGEWTTMSTSQRLIDGEVVSMTIPGVNTSVWIVHNNYVYYTRTNDGAIYRRGLV